jgi:hypothetical protein
MDDRAEKGPLVFRTKQLADAAAAKCQAAETDPEVTWRAEDYNNDERWLVVARVSSCLFDIL